MKKHIRGKFFWIIIRISLGLIFVGAALYKIKSPELFATSIFNYKFVPLWSIHPMAITMPWLQLFCGVALLVRQWTQAATAWMIVMLSIFQIALASALIRGLDVSCGCFEAGGDPATWLNFGRDSLFLLMACLLFWKQTRPKSNGLWMRID